MPQSNVVEDRRWVGELQQAILLLEEWRREPEDANWPQGRTWKLEPHVVELSWAAHSARHVIRMAVHREGLGGTIMSCLGRFKSHRHEPRE